MKVATIPEEKLLRKFGQEKQALNGQYIKLNVNGSEFEFSVGSRLGQVAPSETLSTTLRERLNLTGSKESCGQGACGCCTVIMDGDAVTSCMLLTVECAGKMITTIEGLRDPETGKLSPIQQAFIDYYAFQCGYCTPGIIMTSKALIDKNPNASNEEIAEALSGNYCRCISQYHVIEAVKHVAQAQRRN
jgi:carbon-monoxide dehydrogenase small subunit